MPFNYCFYIHHQGAGHITRAVAIANALSTEHIAFMGSDLAKYRHMIPFHVECIHLPMDTATEENEFFEKREVSFLHYAPMNANGLSKRNNIMTTFFVGNPTCILVVDVSVEVTLLARICGVPTVVIRQHGNRNDLPHRLAYESAEMILAPYPKALSSAGQEGIYAGKTFFSGGFSRFTAQQRKQYDNPSQNIAIFIGQGGSVIDKTFVSYLSKQIPHDYTLHILGNIKMEESALENTIFHGNCATPETILSTCDVIICSAGHNTVMELGDLRKRMICVPAARAFDEQVVKAELLEHLSLAIVVPEEQIYNTDWKVYIDKAKGLSPSRWKEIMNPNALDQIAEQFRSLHSRLFSAN